MVLAKVDIWNMALTRIGERPVESETVESAVVDICTLWYDRCLERVLGAFPWPFATKHGELTLLYSEWDAATTYSSDALAISSGHVYKSLTSSNKGNEVTDTTNWSSQGFVGSGWEYVYTMPADVVRPQALLAEGERQGLKQAADRYPFEIKSNLAGDGVVLCCDLASDEVEVLEYVARIEYVPSFPADFVDALAWMLAAELAVAIRKEDAYSHNCLKKYEIAMSMARAVALGGQQEDPEQDSPSIIARG
jgi:hypothetical protein